MPLSRRDFLKNGAAGLTAFLLPPGTPRAVQAASTAPPVLIALYLRGGADGLNLVVPAGDPFYYSQRPTIQVAPGSELPLDGFFGLGPVLAPLLPLYQSGDLCLLHACGSPDPTRSHFDAQDFMERAAPGDKSIVDGWLNRTLLVAGGGAPIAGVSLRSATAKALDGPAPTLAFSRISGFELTGQFETSRRAALESRYAQIPGSLLGAGVLDGFSALDLVGSIDTTTSVVYPDNSKLSPALKDAAALVKADIGVRVVAIDLGGWDHHSNEAANLANVGGDLAASLAAFYQDLGACAATTLTLCMTEFGRRVAENGAAGSDHGRAGAMLALGGGVAGGRVLLQGGQWPGLAPGDLDSGQDLRVTMDFRNIFAEALHRHLGLGIADLAPVFPDFSVEPANFPGLYS